VPFALALLFPAAYASAGVCVARFWGLRTAVVLAFDQQLSLALAQFGLAGFLLAWTVVWWCPGAPGGLGVFERAVLRLSGDP